MGRGQYPTSRAATLNKSQSQPAIATTITIDNTVRLKRLRMRYCPRSQDANTSISVQTPLIRRYSTSSERSDEPNKRPPEGGSLFELQASYFPAQNWCFGKSGQGRATTQDPPGATGGGFTEPDGEGGRIYRVARFSIARPMLMRLSAMTPRPTQRFIPASPL